jgi:hypothetical protein
VTPRVVEASREPSKCRHPARSRHFDRPTAPLLLRLWPRSGVPSRLRTLSRGEVLGDGHGPGAVVGGAVRSASHLGPGEGEPCGGDLGGERIPQPGGGLHRRGGRGRPAASRCPRRSTRRVEDVGDPEPSQHPANLPLFRRLAVVLVLVVVVVAAGLVGAGGKDADLLTLPDLVPEGLPGPITHDGAGVGPLHENQQGVAPVLYFGKRAATRSQRCHSSPSTSCATPASMSACSCSTLSRMAVLL